MLGQVERSERALFPAAISDYVPADHPARYYVRVAEMLDLSAFEAQYSAHMGRKSYAPAMMLALWLYGYMTGVSSSRKLEQATREQLPFMYIAAGRHPDHSTLAHFRRHNQAAFENVATQFLQFLVEAGVVALESLALDGTKLKAYAAREKMVTAKMARKRIQIMEDVIARLTDQAEQRDQAEQTASQATSTAVDDELLARCHKQVQAYQALAATLDAEDTQRLQQEQAAYEEKVQARDDYVKATGKTPRGRVPKPPGESPSTPAHAHLTDPDAVWMKTRDGIMPAFNAQASVDVETQLIVTADVTTDATDHHQITPALDAIDEFKAALPEHDEAAAAEPEEPLNLLADAGYYRTENVEACETRNVNAYITNKRKGSATALKTRSSAAVSNMVTRMGTEAGKTLYGKRKSTIETTFGCIKDAMGFRFPKMRGLAGVQIEWQLVCLAWNLKRTFNLRGGSLF